MIFEAKKLGIGSGGVDVLFSKVNLIEVVNLDRYRISFFFQVCTNCVYRETSFLVVAKEKCGKAQSTNEFKIGPGPLHIT